MGAPQRAKLGLPLGQFSGDFRAALELWDELD